MAKKKCPILTFDVERIPRGVGINAYAQPNKYPVGFAVGNIKKKDGQKLLVVGSITVAEQFRHCGVGSAIYQQMANAARTRAATLASDTNRSWFSDRFWQKQVKKNTANCVKVAKEEVTHDKTEYSLGRSGCSYYILKGIKVA